MWQSKCQSLIIEIIFINKTWSPILQDLWSKIRVWSSRTKISCY